MSSDFQRATTWSLSTPGVYTGSVTLDWSQGRAAAGSYLLALVVRHIQFSISRPIRTMTVQFMSPLKPGKAQLRLQPIREGRNLTHVQATFIQEERQAAIIMAACGLERNTQFTMPGFSAPEILPPNQCITMPQLDFIPRFTRWYDYRWASDLPFSGAGQARIFGWIRPIDGPLDLPALVSVSDAWPAPVWLLATHPFPSSSVNFHLTIHAPRAHYDEGSYFCFASKTSTAGGGYIDSEARVWGPDGRLLATARQCIAEFSSRE